jgi:oxygen-dependent protoporphyrinogen oxidase
MKKKIAIFGAGISGLAAARELANRGHDVTVYEGSDRIGGLAKTFQDPDGFTYDNGPRFIFSTLAEKVGIADICEPVHYYEHLYIKKSKYRFPLGFIKNPKYCLYVAYGMLTRAFRNKPQNLEEFLYVYYGKGFSREVLQPLIEKWAGIPAKMVSTDFAFRLLPTDISFIIYSIIRRLRDGITEDYYKKNRYIVYPKGSNAKIFEALLKKNNFKLQLNSPITRVELDRDRMVFAETNGKAIEADYFLSTMPISTLARVTQSHPGMKEWNQFHYRMIRILFIKLNQDRVLDSIWHWFPEVKYPFYRIAEYKNGYAEAAPLGKTVISVEFAMAKNDPMATISDQELFNVAEPYLKDLYSLSKDNVIGLSSHISESAYPILKKSTESLQRSLEHQTPIQNLFIAGRTGMFQYKMSEGSYDSAIECAELLDSVIQGKTIAPKEQKWDFSDAYGRPNQNPE